MCVPQGKLPVAFPVSLMVDTATGRCSLSMHTIDVLMNWEPGPGVGTGSARVCGVILSRVRPSVVRPNLGPLTHVSLFNKILPTPTVAMSLGSAGGACRWLASWRLRLAPLDVWYLRLVFQYAPLFRWEFWLHCHTQPLILQGQCTYIVQSIATKWVLLLQAKEVLLFHANHLLRGTCRARRKATSALTWWRHACL